MTGYKYIAKMNGWLSAPHCWKRFLMRPISFSVYSDVLNVSLFGFVFFFKKSGEPRATDELGRKTQAQPGKMAANSASNGPSQRTANREPGCDDEPGREADGGYQF